MVMNIWEQVWIIHIPYQPKESLASSYACPRAPDAQREKEVWYLAQIKFAILMPEVRHNLQSLPAQ